jgi:hypothetical protein
MAKTPVVIPEAASVVLYKSIGGERGWWVREYHSDISMKAHLKHLETGAPPPRHFGKNYEWSRGYGETGPFTKKAAMEYATETLR